MPSRSGPFFISILAVSLLPVACRSRRALLSPRHPGLSLSWQVFACMLHVFHVLLLPAGQDCLIRDQPGPAVLAGSCKVQTLHQMGKPWLPGEVGTSPPMIHASSQAAPQHKAHTCMTQHSTCLSCWRLCMAACHWMMHGQGSNLVGSGLPPCGKICSCVHAGLSSLLTVDL